jgi:hypothetical protein
MTKFRPEDIAPPRQAWTMRLILLGIVLLGTDYALNDRDHLLDRLLADQFTATGEIKVAALSDDPVQIAFKRAKEEQQADTVLTFVNANDHGRNYTVQLTTAKRDEALAKLEALLAKFRDFYGGEFGRDLWTFSDAYVAPAQNSRVISWSWRISMGLLLSGLGSLGAAAWLSRKVSPTGKAELMDMIFGIDRKKR